MWASHNRAKLNNAARKYLTLETASKQVPLSIRPDCRFSQNWKKAKDECITHKQLPTSTHRCCERSRVWRRPAGWEARDLRRSWVARRSSNLWSAWTEYAQEKTAPSMAAWIMSLRVRSLRAYVITDILFAAPCWNLYRGCLGLEGRAFREVLFLNLAFGKGMFWLFEFKFYKKRDVLTSEKNEVIWGLKTEFWRREISLLFTEKISDFVSPLKRAKQQKQDITGKGQSW